MNKNHIIVAIVLLIIGTILIAGCTFPAGSENHTNNVSVNVTTFTDAATSLQIQCPSSGNVTPWIIINPISNHVIGDVFEINGTTNLGIDEKIFVYVAGRVLSAPYPGVAGTTYGTNGTARIWCGNSGINFWNFSVNSSRFNKNFFSFVQVETRNISATNFSRFEMKMYSPSVL